MIRADLSDAGIEYRDANGRVADFHALRHTFISALARGGVHPKLAQQLARHSTITLTMDRYTHTVVGELAAGLQALPDLSCTGENERQRAIGTTDCLPISLPKSLPTRCARPASLRSSACAESNRAVRGACQEDPTKTEVSCASEHDPSTKDSANPSLRVLGLEPKTYGLKGRCSTTELHPQNAVLPNLSAVSAIRVPLFRG